MDKPITGPFVWQYPQAPLSLNVDEVHVWRAFLDLDIYHVQKLFATLSEEEGKKALRFPVQLDRNRYIVLHSALRSILSRYLSIEPRQLNFGFSTTGKPLLLTQGAAPDFRFNLTRSNKIALITFSIGRDVGIDIEYVHKSISYDSIAEEYFSPSELVVFKSVPTNRRQEAFFNCWTRKEAYVKARGRDQSIAFDKFQVSLAPGEPARLVSTNGEEQDASRWVLKALSPGPGYVAALAVEGHSWKLNCWQWNE